MAEDYGNDTDELKKSARIFTSSILKGFYRINLLPEGERPKHEEGKDDESVDGEAQNENLMAMLMGLGGMMSQNEPDMDDEEQEQLNELMGTLGNLVEQLEGAAAEAGIDLDDGSIGDTGFDLYNWTFTEGKVAKGNGWTIAIPDGFVQIKSNDIEPTTGKKRLFELVPVNCKDEKN